MASQEFLASFAVDIDEAGVSRLQQILEENREMAEQLSGAFDLATSAIRAFSEELGVLPGFSPAGITAEGMSGFSGLTLGLDTAAAEQDLQSFIALAKKPVSLSANASSFMRGRRKNAKHGSRTISSAARIDFSKMPSCGTIVERMMPTLGQKSASIPHPGRRSNAIFPP